MPNTRGSRWTSAGQRRGWRPSKIHDDASAHVHAAEAERDTARQATADAEAATGQAQQETARAQAAADAAQAETGRVRADAERALDQARADAAREREELRADLRARAERAERQADAYRAELDRLRVGSPDPESAAHPAKAARRGTRAQAAQPRQATGQ
jgi:chromosome segregation ATPase